MKKFFSIIAASAAIFASCEKPSSDTPAPTPQEPEELPTTTVEEIKTEEEAVTSESESDQLLKEFGLEGDHCHIINGHVPVKVRKGESPIKGGGKLLVIDGGFSKAYQPTSGIAGYTQIYNSRHYRIVSHQPFTGKWNAIHKNDDIQNDSEIFEKLESRMRVSQTDEGAELQTRVDDLLMLLEAYRTGAVTEDHTS